MNWNLVKITSLINLVLDIVRLNVRELSVSIHDFWNQLFIEVQEARFLSFKLPQEVDFKLGNYFFIKARASLSFLEDLKNL